MLRYLALAVAQTPQTINRSEVCQRAGFEDIGADASAPDFFAGVLQLQLHFAQRLLAFGYRADSVIEERDLDIGQALNCRINRIDRAIADRGILHRLSGAVAQRDG